VILLAIREAKSCGSRGLWSLEAQGRGGDEGRFAARGRESKARGVRGAEQTGRGQAAGRAIPVTPLLSGAGGA